MGTATNAINSMGRAFRSGSSTVQGQVRQSVRSLVLLPVDMNQLVVVEAVEKSTSLLAQTPESIVVAGVSSSHLLQNQRTVTLDREAAHTMM